LSEKSQSDFVPIWDNPSASTTQGAITERDIRKERPEKRGINVKIRSREIPAPRTRTFEGDQGRKKVRTRDGNAS